jgi:hypothetical protein
MVLSSFDRNVQNVMKSSTFNTSSCYSLNVSICPKTGFLVVLCILVNMGIYDIPGDYMVWPNVAWMEHPEQVQTPKCLKSAEIAVFDLGHIK